MINLGTIRIRQRSLRPVICSKSLSWCSSSKHRGTLSVYSQETNKAMILMIHLYSDRLMQRPKTVTMDTSHGDSKREKQIPWMSRMWGHSAGSHGSVQMTRSAPRLQAQFEDLERVREKSMENKLKASDHRQPMHSFVHILKAAEAGERL